jgi:CheY-like chemotaxis protein
MKKPLSLAASPYPKSAQHFLEERVCSDIEIPAQNAAGMVVSANVPAIKEVVQVTNTALQSRILVVDDEQITADTLALIFEQHGFNAKAVYSGEEAVKAAMDYLPDIVLSDIIMGPMNGLDAAILIAGALPGCRILLFSGQHATVERLLAAKKEGPSFEVLPKPIPPEVLVEKMKAAARATA